MKKIFLFIMLSVSFLTVNAQTKPDLQDYVGHYLFPDSNLAENVIISIVNDTVLNISSSIGECDLQYVKEDAFSLPQYGGSIIFYRDQNNVASFVLSIPMAGIDNLEGRKEIPISN